MPLNPSAAYEAANNKSYKTPMYLITIVTDPVGPVTERFCTFPPENPIDTVSPYVAGIKGGSYSLTPDEGTSSTSTVTFQLQNHDNAVTHMVYNAVGNLQKKNVTIKSGFVGMDEADMLNTFTGIIVDYDYENGVWEFKTSDVIRELNKYVFRTATEENPIQITGNPVNIILSVLMSDTGDGSNGVYDYLSAGIGMGIDHNLIDIEQFEDIRDTYYPGSSIKFRFTQTERAKGNDFFSKELYKPLNMYPIIKGNGLYSATIYRPPLPPLPPEVLSEDSIIGIPTYKGNLTSMINEVEFKYNYKDDPNLDYQKIALYADSVSINTRGVGDRTLEIASKGLHDQVIIEGDTNVNDFMDKSARRIFSRYAVPPIKLDVKLHHDKVKYEAGDIILVSNKFLPNLSTGTFDFTEIPMEIIKRTVDWKKGIVSLSLLQTGYQNIKYAAISPIMIVESVISNTQFVVEDIQGWQEGWAASLWPQFKTNTEYPDPKRVQTPCVGVLSSFPTDVTRIRVRKIVNDNPDWLFVNQYRDYEFEFTSGVLSGNRYPIRRSGVLGDLPDQAVLRTWDATVDFQALGAAIGDTVQIIAPSKYRLEGWETHTYSYRHREDGIEILNIDEITKIITTTPMTSIPQVGWHLTFNDTGVPLSNNQKYWGRVGAGYHITP